MRLTVTRRSRIYELDMRSNKVNVSGYVTDIEVAMGSASSPYFVLVLLIYCAYGATEGTPLTYSALTR